MDFIYEDDDSQKRWHWNVLEGESKKRRLVLVIRDFPSFSEWNVNKLSSFEPFPVDMIFRNLALGKMLLLKEELLAMSSNLDN